MRNILLTLLLINILAFAYQSWVLEPGVKVPADSLTQDIPELLSARRVSQPIPRPRSVEPNAESPAEQGFSCLRVGPFSSRTDAAAVGEALQQGQAEVQLTEEEGQVWMGHWVQVTGRPSRAAAESARDALVEAGIRDAYIIPGDEGFRISLGVYRRRSSANRVLETSVGLGFDTRVDDRFQAGTTYWLRVRRPDGWAGLPDDLRTDAGQILRTEAVACETESE